MYRLLILGLGLLAALSVIFGFFGLLPNSGFAYIATLLILFFFCHFLNLAFAKIYKAPVNPESSPITALILFFIVKPITSWNGVLVLIGLSGVAMLSKYLFARHKQHIFNPAAFGIFVLGLLGYGIATWWVSSKILLPFVLLFGLLIVRKIRRFEMFGYFLITSLIIQIFKGVNLIDYLFSWPVIFFGTIMLTEPLTTPPTRKLKNGYAILSGVLFSVSFNIGPIHTSPELALILSNLFLYFLNRRKKFILRLAERKIIAKDIYEFSFANREGESAINFGDQPGQYLEFTLPHQKADNRGSRRYFSITSGFDEPYLKIGVKIAEGASSFKQKMLKMNVGEEISVGSLSGDFLLPKSKEGVVFIAGGIGVTPFVSMIKFMTLEKDPRPTTLLYFTKTEDEIAYKDVFEKATNLIHTKTHYLVNQFLTKEFIEQQIPDYKKRLFYLSGPNGMVESYKKILSDIGIAKNKIKTDYFPGY